MRARACSRQEMANGALASLPAWQRERPRRQPCLRRLPLQPAVSGQAEARGALRPLGSLLLREQVCKPWRQGDKRKLRRRGRDGGMGGQARSVQSEQLVTHNISMVQGEPDSFPSACRLQGTVGRPLRWGNWSSGAAAHLFLLQSRAEPAAPSAHPGGGHAACPAPHTAPQTSLPCNNRAEQRYGKVPPRAVWAAAPKRGCSYCKEVCLALICVSLARHPVGTALGAPPAAAGTRLAGARQGPLPRPRQLQHLNLRLLRPSARFAVPTCAG